MSVDAATWRNRIVRSGDAALAEIVANVANWRTHPKHQADALAGVLDAVGYVQQVVINARSGRLVDGHLRVELAERHGETSVPAVWVDLDDDEERLILATLDPLGALAGTDAAQLSALLATVTPSDDALAAMLADLGASAGIAPAGNPADDPGAQIDRAEELRQKWQTARGQLWTIGRHRLLCGDSTSAEDVCRLMGGNRADVGITSPPYNVGPQGWIGAGSKYREDEDERDSLDYGKLLDAFTERALACCQIVAVNVQMVAGNKRVLLGWMQTWSDHLADIAIWDKQTAEPAMQPGVLDSAFEFVVLLSTERDAKRKLPLTSFRGGFQNVYHGPKRTQNEYSDVHKATFPLHLPEWLLTVFSLATSVYEPFAGTGTTIVAAEQAGRSCYGIDIDPGYVAVALERLSGMGLTPRLV